MKPLFCLALAASLGLPACALAAPAAPIATTAAALPQDAQAPVAPLVYHSAFERYHPAVEDDATPDETWRAVNRKVGDAGGHMGHMQPMGKMNGHAMPMAKPLASPVTSATPATQAPPVPAPAPAHHHEEH